MVKLVASVRGHIQIFIAIVIIVADRYTHSIAHTLQTGFFRYVLKGAVLPLVIEAIPILGACFLRDRPFGRWIPEGRAVH